MAHPFHLAFPVRDIEETRRFYQDVLGCATGRAGDDWLDIDFFGSQIVAHVLRDGPTAMQRAGASVIDAYEVPLPHFGAVLPMATWRSIAEMLQRTEPEFIVEPHVRYAGRVNEQASMIFEDPSGNAIELKAFADLASLFATE